MDQEIGFHTTAEGVRIAYATAGQGSPLLKAPNWLSHLGFEWVSEVWKPWWESLTPDHTVVRFDQRGSGLSDWSVADLSFESWVRDLESVADHLELNKFPLLGICQGGPTAIEYAVRHPERVSHLILYGTFARGWAKRGESVEEHEALLTLTRIGWGQTNPAYRQFFTSQILPEANAEQTDWFNEMQRVSTSAENAARIQVELGKIDVLHRLSLLRVPTLVVHARGDAAIPFAEGQQLASLIPNAQLVPLESNNHMVLESEPAWEVLVSEIRAFLGLAETSPLAASPREVAYPDGLTPREIEVLRLVASGKTDRRIADELYISAATASTHVKHILNKTNSVNRVEATAYAAKHQIV
ncbi:MAG: alpha/beta fold hydrolase [Dehalococcoidia bacterium]